MAKKSHKHNIAARLTVFSLLLLSIFSCMGKSPQGSNDSSDGTFIKASQLGASRSVPLYGFNGNNIQGPVWSTPGLLEQIKSLNLQVIRYPGGTVSDWWDWRRGWFINSPQLPDRYKKMAPVPYDLNELKKLVDATGCKVVFTLNITSSTQADQIEMLKTAQKIGIPVSFVELGNEANLPESAGMKKFKGASLYADASRGWISTIKQNFPGVQIALVGGNKKDNKTNRMLKTSVWNKEVLDKNPTANAIVQHAYPKPVDVLDNDGINFQKLYSNYVALFNEQGFNRIGRSQKIWITEYNVLWSALKSVGNDKEIQKYATSWGHALGVILMTSTATQISDQVSMLLNHNLTQHPIFAAIETVKDKNSFTLLPNGIGMKAWLKACKNATSMQKILFSNKQNKNLEDAQLLAWVFTNGSQKKTIILNLTAVKKNISLNNVIPAFSKGEALFADKNKQISSEADVNRKSITVNKDAIELPAYSVTILE